MVKSGAPFRKHVEIKSLILNAKYSQEVLFYRTAYKDQLRRRINELNLSINEDELRVLFLRCPVFYYHELFKAKFKTKEQLFRALSVDGEGFHLSSSILANVVRLTQRRLGVDSDRISDIRVGNNRIRHTVGTNAAMLGYDAIHIAQLLGNSSDSAKIYIDLSDEQRANVDNKFVASIELKKMVNVSVQELQKDERFIISDEFGNSIGSPKISDSCVNCNEPRPIGCYGCPNFIALVGGNHRAIRDRAQQLYDTRVSMGQHKVSLAKLATQIKWIDMTIEVCEEREMLNG